MPCCVFDYARTASNTFLWFYPTAVKEGLISIPRGKTKENLIFMLIFITYTDSVVLSVFLFIIGTFYI
jgi:hypothetical protein